MSSTTDERRDSERGQILVIFAGAFLMICLIAALVFDVGQNLLDRRTEQNASDSAALAGARYLPAGYVYHGGCAGAPGSMPAVVAACAVAVANGYTDGTGGKTVRVDVPPIAPSTKAGLPNHIEVTIGGTRPSFFSGVIGVTQQRTGAMGVATNNSDIALPYSLLALDPHACGANKITGSPGTMVSTNGTVHIDSDCPGAPGALQLSGNGVLTAPECDVVGIINVSGGASNSCTTSPAGVLVSGDPLRNLPAPPQPGMPANVVRVNPLTGGSIPSGCPGSSSPATDLSPATCAFTSGGVAGRTFRLFPGNYPGGIRTSKAILYLSPGIYWIGGSGLHIQSDGMIISKAIGDDTGTAPSGGVLIYNTVDPLPTAGCTGAGCYGPIDINGGGGTPTLALRPIQTGVYKNMVLFVDRTAAFGGGFDIDLNGDDANILITGTIYAPSSTMKFNGSDTDVLSAQVICYSFQVNGSGSAFNVDYDPGNLFHVTGTGLVE